MKRLTLIIVTVVIIVACNNNQQSKESNDTTTRNVEVPISNPAIVDTLSKTDTTQNSEDILKLIAGFSESEFRDSRKELVEQGAEYQYQISEIKELGSTLKYDVVIPDIEGKTEYICNPKRGDFTVIMMGDKDVAQMQYKQNKVGLKWDNCNTTEDGEQCDTYQDMKSYPLKTHFTISIVNYNTESIFTFHRVIMPK